VDVWNASFESVRAVLGVIWLLRIDPLPPQQYMRHAESNTPGLGNRQGQAMVNVHLTLSWLNPEDDVAIDVAVWNLVKTVENDARDLDALDPYIFINCAAP
jgi:hypothetical protein